MPLTNRAPVNAAGQIMVTGTTPTPAWPSLGGMTYDPVTGELAVTSAVPNATDPWVGGLRFTNLGALYIVTTIPSPVFYVGGLPVSTLGQLFMSANPPMGSVGGWPIAGDGGVAGVGSGIGPVPIFWAPLLTTLVPVIAGNPTFTFTRATTAYVADQDGILRQAIANEARFHGARRVRNCISVSSQNFTTWQTAGVTAAFGAIGPTGQLDANTLTAGAANGVIYAAAATDVADGRIGVNSVWLRRRTGTGSVVIRDSNNASIVVAIDGTWKRYSTPPVSVVAKFIGVQLVVGGDQVDAAYAQYELVDGQSNQAPGEYVSVGVLASPWHGAGVDGVKYFATTNGNSVTTNIVTEATGAAIPAATLLGYVAENAATNLCPQSQTFDTWPVSDFPITPNNQLAPDGTLTADTCTDNATNGMHRVFTTGGGSVVAGPVTVSIYAKKGTLPWMQIAAYDGAGSPWANFNLTTGAVGFSGGCTPKVQVLPNGWFRCSITWTAATFAGLNLIFYGSNADVNTTPTYVGTGQTMYLWGAQVEASSDPSSYIPTTTVAVVRAANTLTNPKTSNIADVAGTIYVEFAKFALQIGAGSLVGGSFEAATLFTQEPTAARSSDGATFISGPNISIPANTIARAAVKWSGASRTVVAQGVAGIAGGYDGTLDITSIGIGVPQLSGIAGFFGTLRNVKIYATALTDAELIAMTQ